jgi:hypothetical protein
MKLGTIAIAASALALGLVTWITPGKAQGPMWDVVHVNLPYTVTIGEKTLQPGDYTIQQNRDNGGGSRVLLIYGDSGMKFETSAMTIPALDQNTARDTQVIVHHFGNDYYFDKIWIQGKDYGYEFPVPNSVKAREKEQTAAVTVPAQYSTTSSETKQQTTESAATTPVTPEPAAAPSTAPSTVAESPAPQSTVPSTPESSVPESAAPQSTPPPDTSANSANREMQDPTPAPTPATMPATSAGWLMMLLGGGSLSGIGVALRRKR